VELLHSLKDKITPGLKFTIFDPGKTIIHGDAKTKWQYLNFAGRELIGRTSGILLSAGKRDRFGWELEKVVKWTELIKFKTFIT